MLSPIILNNVESIVVSAPAGCLLSVVQVYTLLFGIATALRFTCVVKKVKLMLQNSRILDLSLSGQLVTKSSFSAYLLSTVQRVG